MDYSIQTGPGYLHVVVKGVFAMERAKQISLDVADYAMKYRAGKILMDGRGIEGNMSMMERLHFGEFLGATNTAVIVKSRELVQNAYVLKPPLYDSDRFAEIVAVNRSMNIKIFNDDIDAALSWLGVEQDRNER